MHEVSLAFFWHQHQPYYPDDVSGRNHMPWVRLHGTKDYWGMAMHLKEVPEIHATINLVPSLIAQIKAYTDRGHEDEHLRVSRLPADSLTEADLHYLLDNFFMVNPDPMRAITSCFSSAAFRWTRHRGRHGGFRRATYSICNAGRTWSGFIRLRSSSTRSWPNSATKAVI